MAVLRRVDSKPCVIPDTSFVLICDQYFSKNYYNFPTGEKCETKNRDMVCNSRDHINHVEHQLAMHLTSIFDGDSCLSV